MNYRFFSNVLIRVSSVFHPWLCASASLWFIFLNANFSLAGSDAPRAADPALEISLFAASPDIVHPIGVAFDARGRLLVIESHTHFRPKDYKGPKHDRIRILEDTDGDGKADKFTTFYEGTSATMGIAVHPDGSVYLATRNEILRLRDTKGDGKADEVHRIAFLETKGDYPHNGLAGLAFDSQGNLYFGMGENIGFDYKLIGADGTTHKGGGEGGNIFWCTADGKHLRRVATGFWNPFGICRDIFGRLFAVDNDPDSMPPCRLLHVVEGGDYGYQYRYGRSGRHPFQSWDGQLPGTLPMVCGVGEAPCQVLSYESDGLPSKYLGNLLVASWADHRIERYEPKERGASVSAERLPFVQGGKDFRPVGIAVAYDGSLFVSDWVKSDYTLHGKGAIWHIRERNSGKHDRSSAPEKSLFNTHRPLRDESARELARDAKGRDFLRAQLGNIDIRIRAACLIALIDTADPKLDLAGFARTERVIPLRAMAVRALAARGQDATDFVKDSQPAAVRFEAIRALNDKNARLLLNRLTDTDPFLRHAAVQQLARAPKLLDDVNIAKLTDPTERVGMLLAWRASGQPEGVRRLGDFLADPNADVRFMAAKWIADENLKEYRPQLVEALKDRNLNVRLFFAYSAALARLDGRDVNEGQMADYFFTRLQDKESSPALRVLSLQMIPPSYAKLTAELLGGLLNSKDASLQLEAMRTLTELPAAKRTGLLLKAVNDERLQIDTRAQAILGLSGQAQQFLNDLLPLTRADSAVLANETLRALVGTKLGADQRAALEKAAAIRLEAASLVKRVLGQPFAEGRPPATDLDAWLKRLGGPADVAAGRRVFFHPKLAGCYKCHRVEGRGAEVGPDLSTIGRTERRSIVESILQPSALVAPHYQAWTIETNDGKLRTGLLINTQLDQYTYLDAQGQTFKLSTRDIAETRPATKSIMPDGLADLMTDQELRDLVAYLCSRR
jgi:putative membrane-bound dehydrogenase-like protein